MLYQAPYSILSLLVLSHIMLYQAPYSIVSLRRPDNMPEELECGFVGDVSEFLDYRPADSPARVAGGEGGGEGAG